MGIKDTWLYQKLDEFFSRDENATINRLKDTIKKQGAALKVVQKEIKAAIQENMDLEEELAKYEDFSEKPDWLEDGYALQPRIPVTYKKNEKITTTEPVFLDPRDIYASSPTLEALVEEKDWFSLPYSERLDKIWEYVIKNVSYYHDATEDWRFPVTTHFLRKGDCEDMTVLFVTLCRLSGIEADEVFNACGNVGGNTGYGHSFPIVKHDDGWYIYETTLPSKPDNPKRFAGSSYDARYGVANWKYSGIIKEEI